MRCRHCRQRNACRPRGLCWTCFYTPGVRRRYPAKTTGFAHRGSGSGIMRAALPPFPTNARPGTPEKIAVLAERAAIPAELFHPEDA
jgi:hypothetical protein